jgi:hypothetical protein
VPSYAGSSRHLRHVVAQLRMHFARSALASAICVLKNAKATRCSTVKNALQPAAVAQMNAGKCLAINEKDAACETILICDGRRYSAIASSRFRYMDAVD